MSRITETDILVATTKAQAEPEPWRQVLKMRDILIEQLNRKRCYMCNKIKSTDDFASNKYRFDGRQSECRECSNAAKKKKKARLNSHTEL